jgi:GntR family transcriptional regulator, transcriptional repressor for pyruvate dehydrogenase complex
LAASVKTSVGKQRSVVEFPPVQRETVMEMVAQRIETMVRSGQLGRGSRLPSEPQLAAMLRVSRASLREALKGMMFLGLLTARPGDGTYLQPSLSSMVSRHFQWMLLLKEIKYLELYELRQILEPAAAALAARRAIPDDLEDMQNALNDMKASLRDPEKFITSEMKFHAAIMQASKNVAIQSTMRMMYGALSEGRHRVMPLVRDLEQHCAKHEYIFSLIASKDAVGARRAVIADLKYAEALLRQNLKDREMASLQPNAGKPVRPLDKRKKSSDGAKKTGKKTS